MSSKGETMKRVIYFWAPWCAPCRAFGPVFDRVAAKHPEMSWHKLDVTGAGQSTAAQFGVATLPTVLVMEDGRVLRQRVGAMTGAQLEAML